MPLTGRKTRQLDGREIMRLWVEMKSLRRVTSHYSQSGKINSNTGKPFTENALWRAAAMFTVENPEEARELYSEDGAVFSDEEWELFVLRRATNVFRNSRSTFLRWVISQGWPKKYEPYFREQFGINEATDYDYFTQTARRMPKREGQTRKDSESVSE